MPREHRRVVWAPKSKKDLLDVWRYYQRVASPEIADKLLREINEAGQRLGDEALMWRARDEIIPGLRSVLVHPYTVFYRINDSVVEIVRVLHERETLPGSSRRRNFDRQVPPQIRNAVGYSPAAHESPRRIC
jgi:toxin ParE1/3/4